MNNPAALDRPKPTYTPTDDEEQNEAERERVDI